MKNKHIKSKLETVIHQAWAETNLVKAKQIVTECIANSNIKSKQTILNTLETITSKHKLDFYLANSLLKFEGMSLN